MLNHGTNNPANQARLSGSSLAQNIIKVAVMGPGSMTRNINIVNGPCAKKPRPKIKHRRMSTEARVKKPGGCILEAKLLKV